MTQRHRLASYNDDFTELRGDERRAILDTMTARAALLTGDLFGERDLSDAMCSLVLAQMCAEARGAPLRRSAVLLHRRAWLERSRGNVEAERALLHEARDVYFGIFEQDPDVQDAAVVRVAYLTLADSYAEAKWARGQAVAATGSGGSIVRTSSLSMPSRYICVVASEGRGLGIDPPGLLRGEGRLEALGNDRGVFGGLPSPLVRE